MSDICFYFRVATK